MENGLNNPGPFTIFLVFMAGLLTSLGPCSISLLPITIAYIGGTDKNKFKLISFSGGVVFSLVALGAASGLLGKIRANTNLLHLDSCLDSNYYGFKFTRNSKVSISEWT